MKITLDEHQCLSFEGEESHIHLFLSQQELNNLFDIMHDWISGEI